MPEVKSLDKLSKEEMRAKIKEFSTLLKSQREHWDKEDEIGFTYSCDLISQSRPNTPNTDEISPDSMRLWKIGSDERFDKDLFRKDEGDIVPAYREILDRLQPLAIQ